MYGDRLIAPYQKLIESEGRLDELLTLQSICLVDFLSHMIIIIYLFIVFKPTYLLRFCLRNIKSNRYGLSEITLSDQ